MLTLPLPFIVESTGPSLTPPPPTLLLLPPPPSSFNAQLSNIDGRDTGIASIYRRGLQRGQRFLIFLKEKLSVVLLAEEGIC